MCYLGENIPKLGFGLMRLPERDGEIDIEETCRMTDMFLKAGYTYFDTAYVYGGGASERAVKAALVDRYPRDSFLLATKLPAWAGAKTKKEAEAMFYTSLERTGAGYFDFYLLHNLGDRRTHFFDDYGIWDFVQKRKEEGLIKHIGFSFHDGPDVLDDILSKHPEVEFVQLQINYADWDDPVVASRRCYETARKHGKPVIIMEPVKGGTLASPPDAVRRVFEQAAPEVSPSGWALRFAASLEGVITVLSGMSNTAQMEENLLTASTFGRLTEGESAAIDEARRVLSEIKTVPCTACGYCTKDCPKNIGIYAAFQALRAYDLYGNLNSAKGSYGWNTKGQGKGVASDCIKCGRCEAVCPQHIKIREELTRAGKLFD